MSLEKELKHVADTRRWELLPFIFEKTNSQVQQGPFKGMTILPYVSWGDGDTASKLLGEYESELHNAIENSILWNPDVVINVGCAEGYYIIGYGMRLPNTRLIAVDVNNSAISVTVDNGIANNVKNIEGIVAVINNQWLDEICNNMSRPLIFMDCEGAELELLDLNKTKSLVRSSIIVECHDSVINGITESLQKRFKDTHNVNMITQTTKNPYKFDFLKNLSDCDKWALVHEGRPCTMNWLYLTPIR